MCGYYPQSLNGWYGSLVFMYEFGGSGNMYTFINTRCIPGGGTAALYKVQGGKWCVTVYTESASGVNHEFDTRRAAVAWRQTLRKI